MSDFQEEVLIRKCSMDEVVSLMQDIAKLNKSSISRVEAVMWLSKSDRFLAAEFRNIVIGAVSYSTVGNKYVTMPLLDFINVIKPFQRKGVATRLCIAAIEDLVCEGFTPIHCSTLNEESYRLMLSLPNEIRRHLEIKRGNEEL